MSFSKAVLILCLLTSVPVYAQEESKVSRDEPPVASEEPKVAEENYKQEEFLWGDGNITSVAKRSQTIGEVANSVSIITREDIEASGATTIPDLFAFVQGVQLFYRNANQPEVIIRGMPKQYSPRLLVLVDDVTVYTPFSSGVFWYSVPVTVDSIERIEVIRGPASVLYGANAFSGVINIITKKPKDFEGVLAKGYAGTLGNYGAAFTSMLKAGPKAHFRFSGEYYQSNGFGADNGKDQDDSNKAGTVMVDGFININDKNKLRLGTWYRRSNVDLPVNNIAPASLFRNDNVYALTQYEAQLPKNNTLTLNQFFNREIAATRDGAPLAIESLDLIKYDIQLENLWNYKSKNFLTVGADYRYNGVKNADLIAGSDTNRFALHMASIYFNDEWKILENLILTGGARYDYDTFSESNWSARANISYLPHPDHAIRASVSRGFRNINFFEEREDVTFPMGPAIVVAKGNPDLEPETMLSTELGYVGYFLNKRLRFNFDFFYNDVNNLILPTLKMLPPNIVSITVEDLGDTNLVGLEYGVKYRIFDWWDFTFDHSFLHQNNNISGRGPSNMINVGNRFHFKFGFSANIAFNWTDNYQVFDVGGIVLRDIGDLYRLDMRLAQKFLKDHLEVALVMQGLIDYPRVEFEETLRSDRRIFGTLIYRY